MSRVVASSNSIVTAIVNSDAYLQSPLMDKWESYDQSIHITLICIGVIIIIYHDFLPPPRRGSLVKSDNTHTHTQ